MHKEDLELMKSFDDILEKEIRKEIKRIVDAGTLNPTDVTTVSNAICLMLKSLEYGDRLENSVYADASYGSMPMRSSITGRYMSRDADPYMMDSHNYSSYGTPVPYSRTRYDAGYSGHSTKDRMIARLEDMMGEAKNEYEMNMIRDTISKIQMG